MKLRIGEIAVDCIIGDLPEEREKTQRVTVDIEMEIPSLCAETDSVDDTVDYAALSLAVRSALVESKCRMIERAAKTVYETVAGFAGCASKVSVSVKKSGAVEGVGFAEAVYDGR